MQFEIALIVADKDYKHYYAEDGHARVYPADVAACSREPITPFQLYVLRVALC